MIQGKGLFLLSHRCNKHLLEKPIWSKTNENKKQVVLSFARIHSVTLVWCHGSSELEIRPVFSHVNDASLEGKGVRIVSREQR